jgi:hypothetical protein
LWLLYREEILIKDILVKRNWHGNVLYCFCNNYEMIQHLLFDCYLAKFICSVIQLTFRLGTPSNIKHVYNAWVQYMSSSNRLLHFVGVGTMFWEIWSSRNDVIFNKTQISSYMLVIFRGTHWARTGHGRHFKRKKKGKYSKLLVG